MQKDINIELLQIVCYLVCQFKKIQILFSLQQMV